MMFPSSPEPVAGLTLEYNERIIKDGVPLGVILIDQRERRISGYGPRASHRCRLFGASSLRSFAGLS